MKISPDLVTSESPSSSKGFRRFHLTASGLHGFVASVGDWFTVLMWMEKLPPWITAPLNNVVDCLLVFWELEDDGQADWDEDEAEVPAATLFSTFESASVVSLKQCCSFLCSSNSYNQIVVQFAWMECHVHLASGSLLFYRYDFEACRFQFLPSELLSSINRWVCLRL